MKILEPQFAQESFHCQLGRPVYYFGIPCVFLAFFTSHFSWARSKQSHNGVFAFIYLGLMTLRVAYLDLLNALARIMDIRQFNYFHLIAFIFYWNLAIGCFRFNTLHSRYKTPADVKCLIILAKKIWARQLAIYQLCQSMPGTVQGQAGTCRD